MTISKAPARAIADLEDGVVLATVDIAASAERVFQCITDPKELVAWWGSPESYHAESWESDLRVGGRFVTRGRSKDGKPYSVTGEFLVIEPPRRLVHTWMYDWDAGAGRHTTVAYSLEPIDGGTRVTVRHSGFAGVPGDCASHASGWEHVLGWLRGHVDTPHYYLCRLIPPRRDFAQTMSDHERSVMQQHVAYWMAYAQQGVAIVFGPVADPNGGWGVAILRTTGDAELARLQRNDPALALGAHYETLPMPRAIVGSAAT
jgi:uncharacterized protein YndB with AHSA1/START domain